MERENSELPQQSKPNPNQNLTIYFSEGRTLTPQSPQDYYGIINKTIQTEYYDEKSYSFIAHPTHHKLVRWLLAQLKNICEGRGFLPLGLKDMGILEKLTDGNDLFVHTATACIYYNPLKKQYRAVDIKTQLVDGEKVIMPPTFDDKTKLMHMQILTYAAAWSAYNLTDSTSLIYVLYKCAGFPLNYEQIKIQGRNYFINDNGFKMPSTYIDMLKEDPYLVQCIVHICIDNEGINFTDENKIGNNNKVQLLSQQIEGMKGSEPALTASPNQEIRRNTVVIDQVKSFKDKARLGKLEDEKSKSDAQSLTRTLPNHKKTHASSPYIPKPAEMVGTPKNKQEIGGNDNGKVYTTTSLSQTFHYTGNPTKPRNNTNDMNQQNPSNKGTFKSNVLGLDMSLFEDDELENPNIVDTNPEEADRKSESAHSSSDEGSGEYDGFSGSYEERDDNGLYGELENTRQKSKDEQNPADYSYQPGFAGGPKT